MSARWLYLRQTGSIFPGSPGFYWFIENLNWDVQMKILSGKYINPLRLSLQ